MSTEMERGKRRLFEGLRSEIGAGRVLDAMERVPREMFVPARSRHLSYEDIPLPIGEGQTISQPYIVALMTHALDLKKEDRVLELGTGSGYQAAILSLLCRKVYSVERIPVIAKRAISLLASLGYGNVDVRMAGDTLGCPEEAPFDAIIVTAGTPRLPRDLLEQMAPGGRMLMPVGSQLEQRLTKVVSTDDSYSVSDLGPCRFVPLLGKGAWDES